MSNEKKIAKCPKCKKDVDYLWHVQSGYEYYNFRVTGNRMPDYDSHGFEFDDGLIEFNCPKCSARLFTSEEEAIEFLSGN